MNNQMGLKECAKSDWEKGIAAIMTGWGLVCRDRQVKKISRKERRKQKNEKKAVQETLRAIQQNI